MLLGGRLHPPPTHRQEIHPTPATFHSHKTSMSLSLPLPMHTTCFRQTFDPIQPPFSVPHPGWNHELLPCYQSSVKFDSMHEESIYDIFHAVHAPAHPPPVAPSVVCSHWFLHRETFSIFSCLACFFNTLSAYPRQNMQLFIAPIKATHYSCIERIFFFCQANVQHTHAALASCSNLSPVCSHPHQVSCTAILSTAKGQLFPFQHTAAPPPTHSAHTK